MFPVRQTSYPEANPLPWDPTTGDEMEGMVATPVTSSYVDEPMVVNDQVLDTLEPVFLELDAEEEDQPFFASLSPPPFLLDGVDGIYASKSP